MIQVDSWSFVCCCGWRVDQFPRNTDAVAEALTRAHLQGHEATAEHSYRSHELIAREQEKWRKMLKPIQTLGCGCIIDSMENRILCAQHRPLLSQGSAPFTPGPWQTNPVNDGFGLTWAVKCEGAPWLASVFGESNARLIAAAPELYAALKAIDKQFEFDGPEWNSAPRIKPIFAAARAALAKADGAG